jgi:phage repressor protein C with HTH and peptisase S24 domain
VPAILPFTARREGVYVVLEAAFPKPCPIGVLLVDPSTDRGWVRFRREFDELTDDTEVLDALEEDLRAKIAENGAEALLASLEDSLSGALRIGERQAIEVDAFTRVVERLYQEHVGDVEVQEFRTHVPLFTLRAAAGSLGEEMQVEAEEWVPAPEGMRLDQGLFAAHVVGRSMEPRIPNGSLNLFRLNPVGSRQGKILLIERFGIADQSARYTVKRYTSRKRRNEIEDTWEHEQIRLEPLNPEFEPWDVEPQDFAVVAEWLRVIE